MATGRTSNHFLRYGTPFKRKPGLGRYNATRAEWKEAYRAARIAIGQLTPKPMVWPGKRSWSLPSSATDMVIAWSCRPASSWQRGG